MRRCPRCGLEHDCPADYEQHGPVRPPSATAMKKWLAEQERGPREFSMSQRRGLVFALLSNGASRAEVAGMLGRSVSAIATQDRSVSLQIENCLRRFERRYLGYEPDYRGVMLPKPQEAMRGETCLGAYVDE